MAKIFNYYANDVDKAWYRSSNIVYSECDDKENELKTLRVVFKNGTQYQYDGVDVKDYLLFRENASQGKALNQYIKKKGYEFKKLDDADLKKIDEEYSIRANDGLFIRNSEDGFIISDSQDNSIFSSDGLDEDSLNYVISLLNAVGKKTKIIS